VDQRKRQIGDVIHGKRIFDILISLQIGYLPKEKSGTLEKKKTASKEMDERKTAKWISGKAEKRIAFILSNMLDARWVGGNIRKKENGKQRSGSTESGKLD
jgi:hypothetical protein